jgi:GntR family transcriptional regulator
MADTPMYRRIADDLQRKIESGELAPGAQLPTEAELRALYNNASRNTVRDAVKWLTTKNLIETQPGRGTFVAEKIDPFVTTLSANPDGLGGGEGAAYQSEAAAQSRTPRSTRPRVEIQSAAGHVASELQIPEDTEVVSRHQERYVDEVPWSLQTSFYPMSMVTDGATRLMQAPDIEEGTVTYLSKTLGLKQAGYRDTIAVRVPDATETAFFDLPGDGRVAVVEILRTAFDEQGKPLRLTVSVFPADRSRFVINVGEVPG